MLAVGSSLRGDDAAGLIAAEHLVELLREKTGGRGAGHATATHSTATHDDAPPARDAQFRVRGARGPMEVGIFFGETAPENLTGEIRRFAPSHVVIIDAADFGLSPGQIDAIDPDGSADNSPGSTHNLPMHVLTNYLRRELNCRSLIVGIQPACITFGHAVNPAISAAARDVARMLLDSLCMETPAS